MLCVNFGFSLKELEVPRLRKATEVHAAGEQIPTFPELRNFCPGVRRKFWRLQPTGLRESGASALDGNWNGIDHDT